MNKRHLLVGASLVFLSPAIAAAQAYKGAGSDNVAAVSEVVVTAQRREQRLQDVPIAITAISGDALQRQGVMDLASLQQAVPGLVMGGGGPTAQPALRGITSSLFQPAENPIAVYLDGVYEGSQLAVGGYIPDIDRVEVLKGPQGTLFGRNATGGAVRIFTLGPSFTPTGKFSAQLGAYDGQGASHAAATQDYRGYVAGPLIKGLLAGSLSGGYQREGGYLDDAAQGGATADNKRWSIRGKLLLTPTATTKFHFEIFDRKGHEGTVASYQLLAAGLTAAAVYPGTITPTHVWQTAYDPGFNKNSTQLYGASVGFDYSPEWGTVTGLASYQHTSMFQATNIGVARSTLACLTAAACAKGLQTQKINEDSAELNYASPKFGIFTVIAGVYYYQSGTHGFAGSAFTGRASSLNLNKLYSKSVYGEVTIEPTDALSVIVGGRYNSDREKGTSYIPLAAQRSKTFNSFTPRVALRYRFTPELNGFASVTKGFKSGLSGTTNSNTNPPFLAVAPETVVAYEAGLKFANRTIFGSASVFYYDFNNKQETTVGPNAAGALVTMTSNGGPVRVEGLDVDSSVRLTDAFTVRAGFVWMPVAKYLDFPNAVSTSTVQGPTGFFRSGIGTTVTPFFNASGFRLLRAPKIQGAVTLTYASGPWEASTSLAYFSKSVQALGAITQASYQTLSADVGYKFKNGVRIGAYGRNITGTKYMVEAMANAISWTAIYGAPPEFGINLGYSF